jgi:hypothetical protein
MARKGGMTDRFSPERAATGPVRAAARFLHQYLTTQFHITPKHLHERTRLKMA